MDWSEEARTTLEWIDKIKSKPMNSSIYEKWLFLYLNVLNKYQIETDIRILFGVLGKYIEISRKNGNGNSLAYSKVTDAYHPILGDYKWAVDTIIKKRKYVRKADFDEDLDLNENNYLIGEISNNISRLDYDDAVNFLGELTGAWILSYPIQAIKKYERSLVPLDWAKDEMDYIYILDRRFVVELEEWIH